VRSVSYAGRIIVGSPIDPFTLQLPPYNGSRLNRTTFQTGSDIGTLIVSTPGICGGRPRIEGSWITVQYIVHEIKTGVTPEEIVTDKPHLTLASVYSALAYCHANKDELDADFAGYNLNCQDLKMSIQS
jgi:uncharacterized protein (DUF433 family)